MEQKLINYDNTTYIQGEPIQRKEELSPLACEIAISLFEEIKETKFISSQELLKLSTCQDLESFKKYFQQERELIHSIFPNGCDFADKEEMYFEIELDEKNKEILEPLEKFIGVDYGNSLIEGKDRTVPLYVRITLKQSKSLKKPYISEVQVINK